MRTPVAHASRQDPHLTDALADGLAQLLVSEYRRRHGQHDQQVLVATVMPGSERDHMGTEPEGGEA